MTESDQQAAVVCSFLSQFAADRSRSVPRPLAEYQARYPGFEAVIAREFEALAATAPDEAEDSTLTSIGRYRDLGVLGRGGMGEVRRVWDPDLRRRVAMKLLRGGSEEQSGGRELLGRFLDEARITSQLQHPGIVPVHELGLDDHGRVYFTMAMVRGRTFLSIIDAVREGAEDWTLTRALGVLQRVCEAVAFAHSRGVIHRDLKPGNIMVGPFGEVYVLDWGVARIGGDGAEADDPSAADGGGGQGSFGDAEAIDGATEVDRHGMRTRCGEVVGTACYMPPEQARGEHDRLGPRTDVYALGAVLRHLLVGTAPFTEAGSRRSSREIVGALLRGGPPPLLQCEPGVPPELAAVCEKAMARAVEDRYASVVEFGADLRSFLEQRVVQAYERGAYAELRKWVRRNRAVAAAAALAVVALGVGLGVSLVQTGRAAQAAARAESHFALATDAMEELVELGSRSLADLPGADEARRRLLQTAGEFHLRFVELEGDDFETRQRAANAWSHVAEIRRELGADDAAEDAVHRARELLAGLVAERPERVDLQATSAWLANTLGLLDLARGNPAAAREHLESSERRLVELIDRGADDLATRTRLVHVVHNLGVVDSALDDTSAELANRRRGVQLRRELLAARPEDVDLQQGLATAWGGLATVLRRLKQFEAADAAFAEALGIIEAVLQAEPESREHRLHAVVLWNNHGLLCRARGRSDAAGEALARAERLADGLVRDFHLVPAHHEHFAMVSHNLALLELDRREYASMRDRAEAAVRATLRALSFEPDSAPLRERLRTRYGLLLRSESLQRDHRALARRAGELRGLGLEDPAWVEYTVGYHLARSAAIVYGEATLTAAERAPLLAEYRSRAVAALRAAFDAGWRDWELRSTVFSELRQDPDFVELRALVDARASEPREAGR